MMTIRCGGGRDASSEVVTASVVTVVAGAVVGPADRVTTGSDAGTGKVGAALGPARYLGTDVAASPVTTSRDAAAPAASGAAVRSAQPRQRPSRMGCSTSLNDTAVEHRDEGESHRVELPTVQAGATLVQEHDHGPVEEVDAVGGAAQHAQGGQTGDGAERPGTAGGAGHREHTEDRGDGEAPAVHPRVLAVHEDGHGDETHETDRAGDAPATAGDAGRVRTGGPRQDRQQRARGGGPARACGSRGRRPRGLW